MTDKPHNSRRAYQAAWVIAIIAVAAMAGMVVVWRAPGVDRYVRDRLMQARGAQPKPSRNLQGQGQAQQKVAVVDMQRAVADTLRQSASVVHAGSPALWSSAPAAVTIRLWRRTCRWPKRTSPRESGESAPRSERASTTSASSA